jgi:hypothetical protein
VLVDKNGRTDIWCPTRDAEKGLRVREKKTLKTLAERIEFAGVELWGPFGWTTQMARGLNMSRSQLFNYRRGICKANKERDVDGDLVALIERERDAATGRKASLDSLKIEVERAAAAARREQKKDARDAA